MPDQHCHKCNGSGSLADQTKCECECVVEKTKLPDHIIKFMMLAEYQQVYTDIGRRLASMAE